MARSIGILLGALGVALASCQPVSAQFSQFGKNKVQYTQFAWQRLTTPHFDVYFFPEEEELAGLAAHAAEATFARLERLCAHAPARRVPLIVYSSHIYFEQTNIIPNLLPEGVGGVTEMLKGRVALPLDGSIPEFERVLAHELVHVFMFDQIRTVLKRHGVTEYRMPPPWLTEGLAELWSGGRDSQTDMVLRDAVFTELLVPLGQLPSIGVTFLLYKEGESICRYLEATYGPDIFERLLTNWWRGKSFAEVYAAVTGQSLEELDRAWQYDLRKRYLPDIAVGDLPSQGAVQLTREGFNMKPAAVPGSGDSTMLVFFRNHRGYTHIARGRLPRPAVAELLPGERSPSIESLHPLTSRPAVSADGALLAYVGKRQGRDHLFVHDLRTGRRVADACFAELVSMSSPAWAPEGARLALSAAGAAGTTDLYLLETGTGSLRQLTDDLYDDREPSWSPDGRYLVFSSDRWPSEEPAGRNLFALDLQDGSLRRLTAGAHRDIQPVWSPDGRHVAYSSDQSGIPNIFALPVSVDPDSGLRHGAPRQVTRVLTGAFDPAWLPRGDGLVFSGYEAGTFQLFRCDWTPDTLAIDQGMRVAAAAIAPDSTSLPAGWGRAGAFSRERYQRRLSLDVVQSQISQDLQLGTSGGVQIGLSDVLGNDRYFFVLSHISGGETDLLQGMNVTLARLHQGRRVNVLWGLFHLNDRLTSRYGRYVREKRTGGYLELSYPLSRHDRVETQFSLRHAQIDRQFEGRKLTGWLATNLISYTHDSSLWVATGPLEGRRYSIGLSQTVDYRSSRRFNLTGFADYRHYVRLSRRGALALRYMARQSEGRVPEFFGLGGSWTLRGYPWMSIWGNRMILANHELRFPLVDRLVVRFPFGDIDFSSFRGALFVDAGNAWRKSFGGWRGSVGAGLRLALGEVFVFRLDGARRTDFQSLGNDTKWDFFFGWDF